MSEFLNFLNQYTKIDTKLDSKGVYYNSCNAYNYYLISSRFLKINKTIFVVLPNLYEAQKYYDAISKIVDPNKVLFYPIDLTLTQLLSMCSIEFRSERLFTIKQLLDGGEYIVITTMFGVMKRQLGIKDYMNCGKRFIKGASYSIDEIVSFLNNCGYNYSYIVEKPGEYSKRGDIIDIYPLSGTYPYRMEFFDDILEEIRLFKPDTQKSYEQVDTLEIFPIYELFYTSSIKDKALKNINDFFSNKSLSSKEKSKLTADLEYIENRNHLENLDIYIPFFNQDETTILDFSSNKEIIYVSVSKMEININTLKSDLDSFTLSMGGRSFLDIPFQVDLFKLLKNIPHIEIENNISQTSDNNIGVIENVSFQSNLSLFIYQIKEYNDYSIIISLNNEERNKTIISLLNNNNIVYDSNLSLEKGIHLVNGAFSNDFIDHNNKLICYSDETIFSKKLHQAIRYRSIMHQALKIRNISEIKVGDYIVHYDYGIGKFLGLTSRISNGYVKDFLQLEYMDSRVLEMPIEQIDLILKYNSYDGVSPTLSKLGTSTWEKTKSSVKKKLKDMSEQLINLYSSRNNSEGFIFDKDSALQLAFENDFEYELTPDQEKAIISTKFDMESSKPMDRLICGDVGYGKTEVALRAAMKAVLSHKQVLYLVPTTILARQHYYTFLERFDKYAGSVELLSRFVSTKKSNEIKQRLSLGNIDILIATHRGLSKDVVFKDLGLLIVDEEQRFGVEQKEKIRQIKVNVDTLILSATPIPRTLQMAILGLKDISQIETPPLNRYPVQTYVQPRSFPLIKEAITREISRGGQVFYLFNRVDGIEAITVKLKELVPFARIGFAHGQMDKNNLENIIADFIDREFDVLVSTTIIETGIDIPNSNTLIIHDAERLGLSQLYQIRGRVGRSDKIAYAYLMFDGDKSLSDDSYKRLNAIKEFTDLGSGFKVAMRDLSIRGAGEILGSEQSGFIDSIGIDLYMKLLQEVIQGEKPKENNENSDEPFSSRHIENTYISDDVVKIEIHKKINDVNSVLELLDLIKELEDRFGKINEELCLYMYDILYKKYANLVGIKKTNRLHNIIDIEFSNKGVISIDKDVLFMLIKEKYRHIVVNGDEIIFGIKVSLKGITINWLKYIVLFWDDYIKCWKNKEYNV
jgi:transcription-repair coupling factor (superfamily II helicase)